MVGKGRLVNRCREIGGDRRRGRGMMRKIRRERKRK
jgi:hypothetical protein